LVNWRYPTLIYALQSRSWVHHLKQQLQNLHQDSKTCTEYLHDAKL